LLTKKNPRTFGQGLAPEQKPSWNLNGEVEGRGQGGTAKLLEVPWKTEEGAVPETKRESKDIDNPEKGNKLKTFGKAVGGGTKA